MCGNAREKFMFKLHLTAALNPLLIFSLASACYAGNEPATTPAQTTKSGASSKSPAVQMPKVEHAIDRPELAGFKQLTTYAFKYRQKLRNMDTMLEQAHRVGTLKPAAYADLRKRLDGFLDAEPALARSNWDSKVVADFDKQLEEYDRDFASGDPDIKTLQEKTSGTAKPKAPEKK